MLYPLREEVNNEKCLTNIKEISMSGQVFPKWKKNRYLKMLL